MAKFADLVKIKGILVDDDILELYKDNRAYVTTNGYVEIGFSRSRKPRRMEYLHRLVLPDQPIVHHIDNNKLNNRRDNLLGTTQSTNLLLMKTTRDNSTRGVRFHKQSGLFHARIVIDKKETSLGYFKTFEEARNAHSERYAKLVADRLEGKVR